MRVGDLLEWLAAAALVAAAYLWQHSIPLGLLAAFACLAYFAQCYGKTPFPRPKLPTIKLPKLRKRAEKR